MKFKSTLFSILNFLKLNQHYFFIIFCFFYVIVNFISTHACQTCVLNQSWAFFITKTIFNHKETYNVITKALIYICVLEALLALVLLFKHIKHKSFYI